MVEQLVMNFTQSSFWLFLSFNTLKDACPYHVTGWCISDAEKEIKSVKLRNVKIFSYLKFAFNWVTSQRFASLFRLLLF